MNRLLAVLAFFLVFISGTIPFPGGQIHSKEFLTQKEIEKIQLAQEIDARVKAYLEAADLRLKTARERFGGMESQEGAPLEFFTVEEMIEGYNRIIKSVMLNLEDAYRNRSTDREKVRSALTRLRDSSKSAENALPVLKKLAEEKLDEKVWNQVNEAIEIAKGAFEGAESGLSELPQPSDRKKGKETNKRN
jgi:hypothetical protein